MSDYAFTVVSNYGYSFGLIATLNAQHYFGTDADWEVAYDDFPEDKRKLISDSFPFKVNWTPIQDLMAVTPNRRSVGQVERYWVSNWILAHQLLRDKKYKVVCATQADEFTMVNLNHYFKLAEDGYIINTQYDFPRLGLDKLTYGNDKGIWDRSQCPLFDCLSFLSQKHTKVAEDVVLFETEDAFMGEANHQVIAVNRAISKHATPNNVVMLEGKEWVNESEWGRIKYSLSDDGDRIFRDDGVQVKACHNRWWQPGRVSGEWNYTKLAVKQLQYNPEVLKSWEYCESNWNLFKSFMERFNNMKPEISATEYLRGTIRRPRYEEGEE